MEWAKIQAQQWRGELWCLSVNAEAQRYESNISYWYCSGMQNSGVCLKWIHYWNFGSIINKINSNKSDEYE